MLLCKLPSVTLTTESLTSHLPLSSLLPHHSPVTIHLSCFQKVTSVFFCQVDHHLCSLNFRDILKMLLRSHPIALTLLRYTSCSGNRYIYTRIQYECQCNQLGHFRSPRTGHDPKRLYFAGLCHNSTGI